MAEKPRLSVEFSSEASINLADDPALLESLRQAKLFALFVGIESPDPETLKQMQKKQNLKRNIAGSIHKFYEAGIFVTAGFIVGFDNEKYGVADGIVQMIEDSAIPVAMAGLLYVLPNTQLTRRLEKEGRLNPAHEVVNSGGLQGDQCTAGLNFDTLRPRRDALFDYCKVVEQAYAPAAYFSFVDVGQFMQQVGQNAPSVPHKSHQDQDPHHSTTALYQTLY